MGLIVINKDVEVVVTLNTGYQKAFKFYISDDDNTQMKEALRFKALINKGMESERLCDKIVKYKTDADDPLSEKTIDCKHVAFIDMRDVPIKVGGTEF